MDPMCANLTDVNSSWANNTSLCLDYQDSIIQNMDHAEFNVMRDPVYVGIVVTLYIIVILFGGVGNTLVVLTIAKTKQLWNATNIFIANLAMADILVCVFDLPINAYYVITDDWVFGKTMCHVIMPAFAVVVYASTWSLTMIAIDRYLLIVHPLSKRISNVVALLLVLAITVVSIAVASPIAFYAQYTEVIDSKLNIHWRLCGENWPNVKLARLYTMLTLALQYFVPIIIIAILYSFIFLKVRERMRNVRSGKNSRKTKTTKMLVAVVTIFAITWTPYHLFSLIVEFRSSLVTGPYYKFADIILRVLAMSSSCINPLLYGWLNDNYRTAFLIIVGSSRSGARRVRRDSDVTQAAMSNKKTAFDTTCTSAAVTPTLVRLNGARDAQVEVETDHAEEAVPLQTVPSDDTSNKSDTCAGSADTVNPDTVTAAQTADVHINGKTSSQMALLNT